MRSSQEGFADITSLLEDMHGLAIEGQHRSLTKDHALVPFANLADGLAQAGRIVETIIQLRWTAQP